MSKEYYNQDLCDSDGRCKLYNPLQTQGKCKYYNEWCEQQEEIAEYKKQLPINDDKHARRNPPKAVEVLKKYINLIEDICYYTIKYIDDTDISTEETFDKLLDQLDELLERKSNAVNSIPLEDKFDNIDQFCAYSCNNCVQDWYCPSECDLLLKARKMPFEKINKKWIEHDGDLVKVWRYIKQYKL